ncbi:MAG: hypothetical protein ACM3PR_02775 [Bacteroidales bacterium]
MKYILAGVSILFIGIISSCVFSPDKENFVELDQSIKIPEIYSTTLDLNSDTLYVWKYTQFNFDFRTSQQSIRSVSLIYGRDTLNFASSSGSFDVNPETFPEGTSQVEIMVYAGSGTGSMADILGLEGIEFKRKWVLIVEKVKPPVINITSTIENGFLKFSWNKMDKEYIKSFKISIQNDGVSDSYSHEFTDKNITSYVDSFYVGGKITFNLWVDYETSQGYISTAIKNYAYDYPIALTFKENLENLTISWTKNPFHFTPYFETSGSGSIPINADSSYTIPAPGLGDARMYNIAFKPLKEASWFYHLSNHYYTFSQGVEDKIKHKNVEYNPSLNAYFFKDEMSLKTANQDLVVKESYDYSYDYNDKYTLTFSKDNQKIYSTVNGNFVTVNTSSMGLASSKKWSFLPEEPSMSMVLKSLDDQTMLIGYRCMGGYRFVLFNPVTASIINQSAKLTDDYISLGNYLMDVSSDGRYAAYSCQKGLYLYEIVGNNQLVLRYHDTNIYYSCLFDPKYPERLILNRENDFQVFNCSTLKADKTIDRFYANPVNIDPKTHYMLLVSNSKNKLYVYDYENDVLKLEMNHHVYNTDLKLINNIIFVNAGYHFDISSYVD